MPLKSFHPPYLDDAMQSLGDQTCSAWRLLVIADEADMKRVSTALGPWLVDGRIRVVANEGRRLAGAINTGMRRATTEFVALLFGDDLWAPEAVAVLSRHMATSPQVDFFHSARRIIDDDSRPISGVHHARHRVTLSHFFEGTPVKHLLCWRRTMALAIGGMDERSRSVGPDDLDFPWTMAEHGALFEAVDDCLYVYRDHRRTERLTTHLPLRTHVRELDRIYRKHGMPFRPRRARLDEDRRTFLRQCLYRSSLDRFLRGQSGRTPPPWRDTYK